ncbi:NAD-dependent epimerase/dehydratase family protein [Streptomyces scabiei]|uniref:NAD-dependent epimerase/dehydratase family protein n=1 Tax=Streptomyces scabiei TaxID=1930 RepID=UPI000765DA6C|nr:NAD-dependent epimerase/dehydratase family protein [Streptomyces scabiei]
MRVLLSGHRGFVGRHLHAALEARGDDVTGIDLADDSGDALDFFRTDDTGYGLAIHCAAIVGGRASIDGSPLGVATNLALDAWYMRWLVRTRTPRAVYFSSSAAYPVALQQPGDVRRLYEEDINLSYMEEPDATYGWAKLTGEKLATYAEAEGCRILVPRPFSGYGEDQTDCYPFPAFIQRARRRDDPFEIWGSGNSTRDWIHISDLVGATLALLDNDVTGPVNLGWGRATSFDDLARIVTTAAGYRPHLKHRADAPRGVHHRVSDPSRMLNHYVPTITLEEGVRRSLGA